MADFMTVTLVGKVTEKPELQVTQTGKSLLKVKMKTSRSIKNTNGEWEQKDATYWSVTAWGELAENAAEGLNEGDLIMALGTISQREWEGRDGAKRISLELNAQHIGRSYASTSVVRESKWDRKANDDDPFVKEMVEEEPPF